MSQHIVAEGTVGKDSIGNGVEARHMEIAHETQPRRVAIVGKQWPKLTYHEPLQTHNNRQGDGSHEPFCRFYLQPTHSRYEPMSHTFHPHRYTVSSPIKDRKSTRLNSSHANIS